MKNYVLCLIVLTSLISGCANIKVVSWQDDTYKFCTNAGNQVAGEKDFDAAAAKQCGARYKRLAGGYESSGNAVASKRLGGGFAITDQKQLCMVYQCL